MFVSAKVRSVFIFFSLLDYELDELVESRESGDPA